MSRRARAAWAVAALALLAAGACGRPEGADARLFQSRVAGFRLTLPESWVGQYQVLEAGGRTAGIRRPRALSLVQFVFMPADTARAAQGLLDVTVFESADWIALSAEPSPPPGRVIAEREGRVWVASLPTANPFPAGPDSTQFAAMRLDDAALKRAFSLW
jgi:hypothetical protein